MPETSAPTPQQRPQQSLQPVTQRGGWRWKRTVVIALLLLIGGAMVNVAVAWGSVLRMDASEFFLFRVVDSPEREYWERRFSFVEAAARRAPRLLSGERSNHGVEMMNLSSFDGSALHPPSFFVNETVAGLPFRSLRSLRWQAHETGELVTVGSIRVDSSSGPPHYLPGQPILPGFIFNTLFYAVILWLLLFAPFTARHMIRRRRGQCEKCAYPVGTSSICTECGAAVR
jgi:hypothetical protein